jgi:nitroreductase
VLESPEDRDRFWAATTPPRDAGSSWLDGMRRAPLIVVPHSHRDAYLDRYAEPDKGWTDRDEARWPVPYWHIDTGFASLLMLLGAVDEGLGACFFGIPPEHTGPFREAFGVPEAFTPIGALTIGYRADDRRSPSLRRGRRTADEVVHRGRWGAR